MKKICFIYCGGTVGMKRRADGLLVRTGEAKDLLALLSVIMTSEAAATK